MKYSLPIAFSVWCPNLCNGQHREIDTNPILGSSNVCGRYNDYSVDGVLHIFPIDCVVGTRSGAAIATPAYCVANVRAELPSNKKHEQRFHGLE